MNLEDEYAALVARHAEERRRDLLFVALLPRAMRKAFPDPPARSWRDRMWPLTARPATGDEFWDSYYQRAHEQFIENLALRLLLFGPFIVAPLAAWLF